jgi:hypothetical protein
MWARHALFWGLVLAGIAGAGGLVLPKGRQEQRLPARRAMADVSASAARIDRLFEAGWAKEGLVPAERASDLAIARRLSLALVGTVPSLEEIRAFEEQPVGQRLDWWLDRLLADRRYADYVAERLARVFVGTDDGAFLLFRRRRLVSWLADQLEQNTPYDQLVRQLIADSGIWTDAPATNFLTAAIKPDDEEHPDPDPNVLAARVSRAMLGIRLDCAECHDHPFAEWKQRDFQGLAAFFAQTRRNFGIRDGQGAYLADDRDGRRVAIAPAVPFADELLPSAGTRRAQLAGWLTHPKNPALARVTVNRAWALLFGKPLVEPIDDLPTDPRELGALAVLADDFIEHGYGWRRLLRVIAATRAFQLDSRAASDRPQDELSTKHLELWAAFPISRLRPEQVSGSVLQAASLSTIDSHSHIFVRLARAGAQSEFIQRYGDAGADEFEPQVGTVPQRLLMMNGKLVRDKTHENLLGNAATQIAQLASSDAQAVETALLAVLTRRPSVEEAQHFLAQLAGGDRKARLEDLYWTLLNSTEFSWNH